jgi:hypothetical protein
MNTTFSPQTVKATPDYVLSVIVDNHRQQCQFDPETDPTATLKFDTTVAEWRLACDLVSWKKLGRALNQSWVIDCTDEQWRAVLHPPRQHTLREVCEIIATHATRPVIRPITMLGKPCVTAGAFLTVRHLLSQAGADGNNIAPSTSLSPFLREFPFVFLGPVSQLAPGVLPPVKIRKSFYNAAVAGFVISLLLVFVDAIVGRPEWSALFGLSAIISYVLIWVAAYCRPESVEFGNLKTFRDLARVLAADKTT